MREQVSSDLICVLYVQESCQSKVATGQRASSPSLEKRLWDSRWRDLTTPAVAVVARAARMAERTSGSNNSGDIMYSGDRNHSSDHMLGYVLEKGTTQATTSATPATAAIRKSINSGPSASFHLIILGFEPISIIIRIRIWLDLD
jgi:hypothetical protein